MHYVISHPLDIFQGVAGQHPLTFQPVHQDSHNSLTHPVAIAPPLLTEGTQTLIAFGAATGG